MDPNNQAPSPSLYHYATVMLNVKFPRSTSDETVLGDIKRILGNRLQSGVMLAGGDIVVEPTKAEAQ